MKIKNNSNRNVHLLGANIPLEDKDGNTGFGRGKKFLVIASSTLEISDEEFYSVAAAANELVEAGVLTYVESPVSKLSKADIIAKVAEEADVELKDSLNKAELQAKAEALGVSV